MAGNEASTLPRVEYSTATAVPARRGHKAFDIRQTLLTRSPFVSTSFSLLALFCARADAVRGTAWAEAVREGGAAGVRRVTTIVGGGSG